MANGNYKYFCIYTREQVHSMAHKHRQYHLTREIFENIGVLIGILGRLGVVIPQFMYFINMLWYLIDRS